MSNREYLEAFFREKDLADEHFEILDSAGDTHLMSTQVVIDALMAQEEDTLDQVATTLRRIDFQNRDTQTFIRYVAEGLVEASIEEAKEETRH